MIFSGNAPAAGGYRPYIQGLCKLEASKSGMIYANVAIDTTTRELGDRLFTYEVPPHLRGEVFVDLGLAIKQASPFKTTLVVELANHCPAYIPTKKAFVEGSYEIVNSRVASGGGEKMVELAIELLKELSQ